MLMASECHADWRIVPTLSLTERYTDNVRFESDELKQSQFITELTPGIGVFGKGRRFELSGNANWRHFDFRNEALRDKLDHSFEYAVGGNAILIDDLLMVDASATSGPQGISAFGPQPESAPYLAANRAKIETWRISPRLEHRFGQQATAQVRYTRDSVKSDDVRGFGNSNADNIAASLSSGSAFATLGWGLSYQRQDLKDSINGESSSETAVLNLRYALTKHFSLIADAGYDRYDFEGPGGGSAGRNWSVGFDWTPSTRTHTKLALGRHFYGQTGLFLLSHRSRRTTWNISYNDAITTSRSQFLLPATFDTAALLDGLFTPTFPDPELRRQAVAAYIRNNGLPSSLDDSINFLSNRYVRQKSLQASMGFKTARLTTTASLFGNNRLALSSQQSDSALLGPQDANLNDNVRQRGATLGTEYRINSRSSAQASATWTRSRSISGNLEDLRRDFRIGLARQLGRHARAALELRRSAGSIGFSAGPYHEHAISATLSAEL